MTTDKKQPTIDETLTLEQITYYLALARTMNDRRAIKRLTAQMKNLIDKAFHAKS